MEPICFSFSSMGLVWEKPAHSGTLPSHSPVCEEPRSFSPFGDTKRGMGARRPMQVAEWPRMALGAAVCHSPQRAGSCRQGPVAVAANRRGSGSVEGLSDTRPDIR